MSNIQDMISSLIDSIKNTGKKTNAYDTSAEVKRIEGDTAWVHIPGGVDETPVKLTINASEGDNVQVRVNGGRAWLQGNATAPPTDDTTANVARTIATDAQEEAVRAGKAADAAEAEAVRAGAAADRAEESASDALTAAQSAQTSADSALVSLATVEDVAGVLEWITNHGTMTLTSDVTVNPSHVYFVVDAGGDYVVGSTHYSIVSEPKDSELSTYYELSVDKSIQNYVATHVAVNSEGLWLIPDSNGSPTSNGKKILIATGAGSTYTSAGTYIIDRSSGTDHVYAKFLADGATMTAGDGTLIAHLGYGSGTAETGTDTKPYYSLGERSGTIGNYSVAEGVSVPKTQAQGGGRFPLVASGYASHAECGGTTASGTYSHAEGVATIASGFSSHAEGRYSEATGNFSHAQGDNTYAAGSATHVSGIGVRAGGDAQTAIGKWNDYGVNNNAFTIGNGTADNARSNALTVDWNGNVNIPSGAQYKINGTPIGGGDVTGVKGNAESTYRTGNVNITPANVGAVALSDKYTRSSTGDLGWTGQTDGDAKVIAKSALAFWSGAYSGNSSNLSKCSTGNIIGSNGGTMTGQLLTSFKSSVAMGSYGTEQTTLPNFVEEVRFSSGCMGSVSINTAYTKNGITIPAGWYNFIYSPHRTGGNSGAASGDNCNYGTLILASMTVDTGIYFVRVSSAAIQQVARLVTTVELQQTLSTSGLSIHSSRCSISSGGYYKIGKMVYVQLKLTISASLSANNYWTVLNGFSAPATGQTALAASVFNVNGGAISAHLNDSGSLIIETDNAALANGNIVLINGTYLSA